MNNIYLISSSARRLALVVVMALAMGPGLMPVAYAADDEVGVAVNDTTITAKVKAKLNGTSSLEDAQIDVSTSDGVVTLTGTVKDEQDKDQAEEVARKVNGVKDVNDQLTADSDRG